MLFQVRMARGVTGRVSATRAVRRSGWVMLAACAVFALSAGGSAWPAAGALVVGAVLQVVAEMGQSAGSWQLSFDGCQALIARLKGAGGRAQMLSPAETAVHGNSHMIMQDKNNLQIADLILKWIDEQVGRPKAAK